jgi:glyoxylase-like metal-dependent hydrolase (beta-lactamase superfamily II)
MEIHVHTVGPLDTNLYLLLDEERREVVVVDPGPESEEVLEWIQREGWKVRYLLNTHAHFDHIGGNARFHEATQAPIALHPADRELYRQAPLQAETFGYTCAPQPEPTLWLEEGQRWTLAGQEWTVLHTPGHSPGSVCLYTPGHLLVGDLLFAGSVGRMDLPGGSWEEMVRSLHRLFTLPPETRVYPGHGPRTTLAAEWERNFFVRIAFFE